MRFSCLLRRQLAAALIAVLLPLGLIAADTPYIFTTIAGSSPLMGSLQRFAWPLGLAIDPAGMLYVVDGDMASVFKVTSAGDVSLLAGKTGEYAVIDGPAATARFKAILAAAMDGSGNLFVADSHTIRKITPAGEVTTYAGLANTDGTIDGPRADARFGEITALAFDHLGNLYAADSQHHTVRKITPAGDVTTFAGSADQSGSIDGSGAAARFVSISALAVDSGNGLYLCEGGSNTVRRITSAGVVTTFAGSAGVAGSADGQGAAARFNGPRSITLDPSGNIFVGDNANHTLRKITPAGAVSTFAGSAGLVGSIDGTGGAARFFELSGLVSDAAGNLFGTDAVDGTIRRITPAGVVTTLVGVGRDNALESIDGPDTAAALAPLTSIAIAANNDVYIADYLHDVIRKVPAGGKIFTFAGGMDLRGYADGAAADARFSAPFGVAVGPDGTVYVADLGNDRIRKITPAGVVSTLTGLTGAYDIRDGIGDSPAFHGVIALTVDADGAIYVCDSGNYIVRKITAAGVVSTVAGNPHAFGEADGTGPDARFYNLTAIVRDAAGNLYVLDRRVNGAVVRKIAPGGVVTTVADSLGATGLTVDAAGNVYIAGPTLQKISPSGVKSAVVAKDASYGKNGSTGQDIQFEKTGGIAADPKGALYLAAGRAVHKGQPAAAPAITTQPAGASVKAGESVRFAVAATALPAPTYQWYFNGAAFQGATGSELSFSNARAGDAGDYTVVATNILGSTTSTTAKLVVSAAATPTTPNPSSGGGSGGGGAPSAWFLLALAGLAGLRRRLFR